MQPDLKLVDRDYTPPVTFTFPGSRIPSMPLYRQGSALSLGLVEIGCKPAGKGAKLRDTRELILNHVKGDYAEFLDDLGIRWSPRVYRVMGHYTPFTQPRLDLPECRLDAVFRYSFITKEMLEGLDTRDKRRVFKVIWSTGKKREVLERILEESDAEGLHDLIVNGGDKPRFSFLRGKMAEILAQKDIERAKPKWMPSFRNGTIKILSERFGPFTEVDTILAFYREKPFVELVEGLRAMEHLEVYDMWHN